jgi:LPS sulfotransferase NodH
VLANVQHELGRPVVAKNVLGAHHMPRLRDVLGQVFWVWVERDPLDACISILDARRHYYGDESRWWSYVPPEYPELEGLDAPGQIAGQVHYLGRFYDRALAEVAGTSVRIRYEELCASPAAVLDAVGDTIERAHGVRIPLRQEPPPSFGFRTYADRDADKETFARLLDDLRRKHG